MERREILKENKLSNFGRNLFKSFLLYKRNDPLRLAGATAFFANFAIPPILLILIRLFGFFVDKKLLTERLFERISEVLIPSSTLQIKETLLNIRAMNHQWWATVLSFIFLLFVATTLFSVIKNSVEQIWNIGQSNQPGMLVTLKSRLRSMGIIIFAGLLFLISLFADTQGHDFFLYLNDKLWILWILNQILFTLIVSLWFAVVFRFLTNARPKWNIALKGGVLTGVLFNLGKHILRVALPMSNIEKIYGTSGAIILVTLFVFYSALIFYFGACYIKIINEKWSGKMRLKKGAFRYEIKEIGE